ncbi:MAG: hypothetical protein L6R40_001234 [Gallowayella cf. fulva]|nr:MAG: hypothetical protein L6R40_001234 [Xanthomendoza cf. fulva]
MHFPNPHLILPLLSILPSLFPPTIAAPSSPQLANPLSIPPSKLPAHPHLRTTTDPLPLRIPIPKDPHGRYITLIVHIAAHPLSEQQIGECLVALNQGYQHLHISPPRARGAYIEIEEGEDEGRMRFETLSLAISGLWLRLMVERRFMEVGFEVWDERGRHVGDGVVALEEEPEG